MTAACGTQGSSSLRRPPRSGLTLGYFDDPTAHTVTVMPTYAGDCNLDGIVDVTDLNLWAANAGKTASWQAGDLNYDGVVNLTDLKLLKASIGLPSLSGVSSGAAVPEPSTLVLSAIALLAVIGYRRRSQHSNDRATSGRSEPDANAANQKVACVEPMSNIRSRRSFQSG